MGSPNKEIASKGLFFNDPKAILCFFMLFLIKVFFKLCGFSGILLLILFSASIPKESITPSAVVVPPGMLSPRITRS
jgi:hypothetical protein